MRVVRRILLIVGLCLNVPVVAEAANHYIRDGGLASTSGTGACTSWADANACDTLPSTLVRGDTYYIADGTYVGRTLTTVVSGSTLITIKKATTSDHVTETGWLSTYGDGIASFTSQIRFNTDYWVFDGIAGGGPGSWNTGHGFVVTETGASTSVIAVWANNITVRHIKIVGMNAQGSGGGSAANDGFEIRGAAGVTLSYAWIVGAGRCPVFAPDNGSGTNTVEYSFIDTFWADLDPHGETAAIYGVTNSTVFVWRYNLTTAIASTGGLMWDNSTGTSAQLLVYGNVFYEDPNVGAPLSGAWGGGGSGNGMIGGWTGFPCRNIKAFNNSFILGASQYPVFGIGDCDGVSNEMRNNVFYAVPSVGSLPGSTVTHNHFISTTTSGTSTSTSTGDPFLNYAGWDFHLTSATTAGTTLASPYDVDMYGVTRGADGTWDRGAIEFGTVVARHRAITGPVRMTGGIRNP